MKPPPAHQPDVLYRASLERVRAMSVALDARDYVLSVYLGGVAVECILQAVALRQDPTHDARHDLAKWLHRCPTSLQDAVKSGAAREAWQHVVLVWRNHLRYFSEDAMLQHLKDLRYDRGLSGDPRAIMRVNATRFGESVAEIHGHGVASWHRNSK